MKISSVKSTNINFTSALNSKQIEDYKAVYKQAHEALGTQGKKVLIVHDASLPQTFNTGVGNLLDKKAVEFIDLMKSYLSINTVELLPQGEYNIYKKNFIPYQSSALSLGQHLIDPMLLTTPEYGKILSADEINELVRKNLLKGNVVNYENVVGRKNNYDPLLKNAYERFCASSDVGELKEKFGAFKTKNQDWLVPKALFARLAQERGSDWRVWDEADRDLYLSNTDESLKRIDNLKQKYTEDIDFYSFKQFLSQEHLGVAKKNLNAKGIDLTGDCLINFSWDEIWANQKAFMLGKELGWGITPVDFNKVCNSDGSLADAGALLRRKFSRFFELYDGVRFDVGWAYIQPTTKANNEKIYFNSQKNYIGDSVLKLIEKTAKETKGGNYDLSKLFYETVTGEFDDFKPFDDTDKVVAPLKNRVQVFTTEHKNHGWGSIEAFINRFKLSFDEFLFGATNHDSPSLKSFANSNAPEIEMQRKQLAQYFNISEESLKDPVNFVKAKFAETFMAKNQMYFFNDILGNEITFDSHCSPDDYRIKIPNDFEKTFHKAIQEGYGLNPMDGLEKIFILRGLDKTKPELFKRIQEFNRILSEPGAKTQKEADEILILMKKTKNKHLKFALAGLSLLCAATFALITTKKHKKNAQDVKETVELSCVNQKIQTNKSENEIFSKVLNS